MVRNKRSKGKIKNDYVNEDIYNYYCSISSLNIPKKIFFAIIKEYILFIVDKMLTEDEIKLCLNLMKKNF